MNKVFKVAGIAIVVIAVVFIVVSNTFFGGSKDSVSTNGFVGAPRNSNTLSGISENSLPSGKMVPPLDSVTYRENALSQNSPQTDKRVIKNGNLSLKIDNADEASKKINEIAEGNGGEVFSSNFYQSADNVKNGTVTVKVPVVNFERAYGEIKKVATVVIQESTSGQDVTEQYVDLKAQLANAQAEEQTFVRILDRAEKIDDVLAVTRELSRVRGTIEQFQGKITFLESQTDMATISVNLTEDQSITAADSWRPFQVMKDSVNSLIQNLREFIDFAIRFLIGALPLLIIWGVIIWLLYRIVRKIYLKMKSRNENL